MILWCHVNHFCCSVGLNVYVDSNFYNHYGYGVTILDNMFYGQHGVENTFNLENGLGVRFEFDLKDTHKLGFSTEPSYLKMRYICVGKYNYQILRIFGKNIYILT